MEENTTYDNLKQNISFYTKPLVYHHPLLPTKEDQNNSFAIKTNSLQNMLEKHSFVKHV